jgi:hypothetical protein
MDFIAWLGVVYLVGAAIIPVLVPNHRCGGTCEKCRNYGIRL